MKRKIAAAAAALAWSLLSAAPSFAAELIMIEQRACEWCALWNEEVGVVYGKTDEGRRAPLRRVDIRSDEIDTLNLATAARYTPTFVLIEGGEEIGRIEGYPGEDFFWGLLGALIEKLPAKNAEPDT